MYILTGLTSGEIVLVEYGSFKVLSRTKVANSEIVEIRVSNKVKKVVLTSMGKIF